MNNDRRATIRKLAETLETCKDQLGIIVSDEEECITHSWAVRLCLWNL